MTSARTRVPRGPAARKKLLDAFDGLTPPITPAQIKEFLGHDTAPSNPEEVKRLRGIFTALRDGHTTWESVMEEVEESRAAFGGGGPDNDDPAEKVAVLKRLAELRLGTPKETFDLAVPEAERENLFWAECHTR